MDTPKISEPSFSVEYIRLMRRTDQLLDSKRDRSNDRSYIHNVKVIPPKNRSMPSFVEHVPIPDELCRKAVEKFVDFNTLALASDEEAFVL